MANLVTRPMRFADIDDVIAIERDSFSIPWSRGAFVREILENQCARYLTLLADGRIVAYAGMWLVLDEGHITNVAVRSAFRGMGYGEALLRALMQTAADEGASLLTLEVRASNVVAQSLYRKLGFKPVGVRKNYYEDNREDAVLMTIAPLPDTREIEVDCFWRAFLCETGMPGHTRCRSRLHFGMTRSESDRLLDLTLRGIKQTVFFALPSYDITGSAIPVPGDLSMVTDFYGHPKCVIMTKRVSRVRFADVTREACGRDGNYPDLYAWRSAHSDLFTAEGAALGYCFTTDMKVLVEEFSVVYR